MTYGELARRMKVSERTIKRDLSRGTLSLERLDQICDAVGINLEELVHPPVPGAMLTQCSDEQKRAIVSRPKLLLVAYLTTNDWRFQEILATEFEDLAHKDARRPLEERDGCSAILSLRSWEFSEFNKLRRK